MNYKNIENISQEIMTPRLRRAMERTRKLQIELDAAIQKAGPDESIRIHGPEDAASILRVFMAHLEHEEVWVILLGTRNNVMGCMQVYRGTVNYSYIRVAEVFKTAIERNACQIILAHNHPTGDPTPSPDDVAITKAVVEAGKLLDIDVLDHLIVGHHSFVSMKERKLGFA